MKSQEKKEYLMEYQKNIRKAKSLYYQVVELNACKENIHSQRLSFTTSSGGGHKDLSDIMVEIEKRQEELLQSRISIVKKNLDIQKCLKMLEPDERDLLYMRYIKKMSWDKIADNLGYSESHVKGYIHGRALKHLDLSPLLMES